MPSFSKEIEDEIARNTRAMRRQELEPQPANLFADVIEIQEEYSVVHLTFRCSRFDVADALGGLTVVVARLSVPRALFDATVKRFYDDDPAGQRGAANPAAPR